MDRYLLPVFPLNIVLLPEEVRPLHIFEERFKQMIGQCLEAKAHHSDRQEFGIVLARGEETQSVGCTARIPRVLRKYPDGRMDILTIGRRRFEVLYTDAQEAYLRCGVNVFDDEGRDAPADADAARTIDLFRQVVAQMHEPSAEPRQFPPPYRYLSFHIAGSLPLEIEFKQELLSLRSEAERLERINGAMIALIEQLQLSQRAQGKTRGNGDLRHRVN
ncbi:MAG: LON peptidase substrate-binding domain-containing protein [Acidobacteria bacterium]|nr:LON peptidase substrate-binding domain-containing protein [Acidobacteriota bacterium]